MRIAARRGVGGGWWVVAAVESSRRCCRSAHTRARSKRLTCGPPPGYPRGAIPGIIIPGPPPTGAPPPGNPRGPIIIGICGPPPPNACCGCAYGPCCWMKGDCAGGAPRGNEPMACEDAGAPPRIPPPPPPPPPPPKVSSEMSPSSGFLCRAPCAASSASRAAAGRTAPAAAEMDIAPKLSIPADTGADLPAPLPKGSNP